MDSGLNPRHCHYKVLKIEPTALQAEITKAFKRLAKIYHPDKNKFPNATAKFQEINSAHGVLSNPGRRRDYDNACAAKRASAQAQSGAGQTYTSYSQGFPSGYSYTYTTGFSPSFFVWNGNGWTYTTSNVRNDVPRPPTVTSPTMTSPTGGTFTTNANGRSFTAAQDGHTYVLDGPSGTFTTSANRVQIIVRGNGWTVKNSGDQVTCTVHGSAARVKGSGDGCTFTIYGSVAKVTSSGDGDTCIAYGSQIKFNSFGDRAHCDAYGANVTFKATGDGATYSSSGLGFRFIGPQ